MPVPTWPTCPTDDVLPRLQEAINELIAGYGPPTRGRGSGTSNDKLGNGACIRRFSVEPEGLEKTAPHAHLGASRRAPASFSLPKAGRLMARSHGHASVNREEVAIGTGEQSQARRGVLDTVRSRASSRPWATPKARARACWRCSSPPLRARVMACGLNLKLERLPTLQRGEVEGGAYAKVASRSLNPSPTSSSPRFRSCQTPAICPFADRDNADGPALALIPSPSRYLWRSGAFRGLARGDKLAKWGPYSATACLCRWRAMASPISVFTHRIRGDGRFGPLRHGLSVRARQARSPRKKIGALG
jgi:hypothetical protein